MIGRARRHFRGGFKVRPHCSSRVINENIKTFALLSSGMTTTTSTVDGGGAGGEIQLLSSFNYRKYLLNDASTRYRRSQTGLPYKIPTCSSLSIPRTFIITLPPPRRTTRDLDNGRKRWEKEEKVA